MEHYDLNEENHIILAIKAYDSTNYIMSEFEEDIKRVKYIKRLFRKYRISGELKERLILNHLIILYNVFDELATKLLFLKIDSRDKEILKTFLLYLHRMPNEINTVSGKSIKTEDIGVDLELAKVLRKL